MFYTMTKTEGSIIPLQVKAAVIVVLNKNNFQNILINHHRQSLLQVDDDKKFKIFILGIVMHFKILCQGTSVDRI